ncbi:uncharacterized protein LOC117755434 isoform X1 [Hippoglossus hippoglossus]|uniref:uncharacterized protein LOC117755434 isoform X1 n=1 Tax=Hippoglossus hippoglossus TaxID=8267 RepID=UPI00148DAF32|nr:uncharacterized protein LOC117755434 isoform X1 [Hippoglossus hippoglossus]
MIAMFHLNQAALLTVHLVVMCPVLAEILQFFPDDHRDILVSSGDSVTFTCNISTNRTSQINWTKGKFFFSHSVSLNQTFSNVTSDRVRIDVDFPSKLNISNAQLEDSGLYQCSVTDRRGAWSNRWNLTVAETPPEVLSSYFLYTILPGVVLLLFGITAAVCLHRIRRAGTSHKRRCDHRTLTFTRFHVKLGGEHLQGALPPQPQSCAEYRLITSGGQYEPIDPVQWPLLD